MRDISRRTLVQGAAALGVATALAPASALAANNPPKIGIVGKVKIPWFDNVEKGVLKAGQDLGVDASIINPTTDDPAEQVRAIEDLIAKKVDVIGVVPNDGKALEPVLKRAQDAGIKVVMNESPGQKNADWDIELIQDKAFGEAHLEAFAEAIGGEGKYVVFVGGLTVALHNLWADYAVALQKEKYPKMQQVGDRFGVSNSVDDSYKTAMDQMQANPDLKGFLIFGANGPIGAGNAVTRSRPDRQGHRRRPVHPEPGTQADEIRRDHARLPVEPDRTPAMRWWRSARRWPAAPRSRTASTCRAWDHARSTHRPA